MSEWICKNCRFFASEEHLREGMGVCLRRPPKRQREVTVGGLDFKTWRPFTHEWQTCAKGSWPVSNTVWKSLVGGLDTPVSNREDR